MDGTVDKEECEVRCGCHPGVVGAVVNDCAIGVSPRVLNMAPTGDGRFDVDGRAN